MLFGGEAVTTKLEVVVDPAVGGKEALCMTRRLEPLHLPFSSSRLLMRHLGSVVEVSALAMLDTGQDLPLRRAVAAQLIGHDHPRHVPQAAQQLRKNRLAAQALRRLCQDVEHVAVLVHGPALLHGPERDNKGGFN